MSNKRAFSSVVTGVLLMGLMVQAQEIRGTPGVDYPNYDTIPKTSFSCSGQKHIPGLYADMETDCQVFHFCDEHLEESFLCPPGMTFNQASLACDFWDKFNCSLTPQFYSMNTGPEMDNARRNILMVLQLKNRSRKPSIRPSDVYDKITSLYDSTIGDSKSESPDLATVGVKGESSDKISREVGSEMPEEARERSEENESQFNQDLSGIDASILNDEFAYISEDVEPEIFYDPVTEKYYVDYDSSQNVNDISEETVDKDNLNYGGFGKSYGLPYNEYVDEISRNSESEHSTESLLNIEFNKMLATAEASEKELSGILNTEQRPLKRVRRRPLYRVQEDTEVDISGVERGVKYPIDYVDQFTTETTDTEFNFALSGINSDGNEMQENLESKVSYSTPDELQYPNIESIGNPEVPQTSELDQAVLSELAYPEVNEHGLGRYLPSEEEQAEESMQNDSQTADEYSYIENVTPDYESYSTDFTEVDGEIVRGPEFAREIRGNEENWYTDEESLGSEDSVKSEDTYMVIPDEYDDALDEYSKTNGQTETFNAQNDETNSFGSWNGFLPSYVPPAVYAPVGPYWSAPPFYYPDGYGRQLLPSEHLSNSDSSKSPEYADRPADQPYQYDFANISPERYFPLADSGPYAYASPVSFQGHVYDYGTGYVYPYANVYSNSYTGNFAYDTSEVKVATESPILGENPEANSDYSESEMQYWPQSYSTERPEIEEEMEITSVLPTDGLGNMYVTSMANGELNEMPSETSDAPFEEKLKESETFYLFDFDDNSEEDFKPDNADEVLDTNQLDSNELAQADEPSLSNESLDLESINESSESESTGAQTESNLEDFDKENSKRLGRSEAAENGKSSDSSLQTSNGENRVHLSASGIAGTNTPQAQSPRQPRSYGSNIDLSRDPKSLISKLYSESNFRLQDAGLAQSYGTEDVSISPNMEDGFFHRNSDAGLSRVSKLSELQKRIISLKQGKLGTFKKYMNTDGNKN